MKTAQRPLPLLTDLNRFFWTGGADGTLRMQRCGDCGYWLHPPGVICPQCLSRNVSPQALSGLGTVAAVTLNYQAWLPGVPLPYAVAIVSLPEQAGLNLTTNIVGVSPETVHIGQPVRVVFEQFEDVFLPFFTPVEPAQR